jgi:hypothetical protein
VGSVKPAPWAANAQRPLWVLEGDREEQGDWAFGMRTAPPRAERMAPMGPSPQQPSTRPLQVADLALTAAAVVLGLLTVALQRSAGDPAWRDVDALAVALVLLMALPAATCRRAPIASAVIALSGGVGGAALR